MTSKKDLKQFIIEGIHERKGRSVSVIDFSHIDTAATGAFIIADGNSTTHIDSIADCVEEYVRENAGVKPYGIDGDENSDWVIMDYGNVWVHIFLPETRRRYNLEDLWSDARITEVADID